MAPRRSSSSLSAPSPEAFHGYVDTTLQALHLVYAAHKGIIPRITRRLNETERRTMIRSGATFVFSVDESGIKRWTDGMVWSPSRIVGNFLIYREMMDRTVTRGTSRRAYDNSHYSTSPHAASHNSDPGTFKPDGLIKKTITVTLDQTDLHLISYYTAADWRAGRLDSPSSRQDIMTLELEPRKFRVSNFRIPPKIERLDDGREQFVQTERETTPQRDPYTPSPKRSTASPVSFPIASPGSTPYSTSPYQPHRAFRPKVEEYDSGHSLSDYGSQRHQQSSARQLLESYSRPNSEEWSLRSPLRGTGSDGRRGGGSLDQPTWSTARHSSSSLRDGGPRASTSARTAPYHTPQRNTTRHRSALPIADSSDWASGSGHSTGLSNPYDLSAPFGASSFYQSTQPYEGNSVNVGGYSLNSQATWSGESL